MEGTEGETAARVKGVVTIDGPAASGKSTVARLVARQLNIPFVSSGLLYRAATKVALDSACNLNDGQRLQQELEGRDLELVPDVNGNRIHIDGREVTAYLHTDEIDAAVSRVASHPGIREWVNARLREVRTPFVVEGRDMGTVVFPHAQHKFYLTAPASVRAMRRLGERAADLAAVAAALRERDEQDAERLAPAPDALSIDTGDLTLSQVVEEVLGSLTAVEG